VFPALPKRLQLIDSGMDFTVVDRGAWPDGAITSNGILLSAKINSSERGRP
jgi:hypothetical protein